MEINYLKYKIRNGDSLHSISSRLGMTVEELKLFHNTHCEKLDTLWFENISHIESLWVPQNYKTEEQKEQEKREDLPSLKRSNAFHAKEYKVCETFESIDELPLTVDYTVSLESRKLQNKPIVTFNRKDFITNGEVPDNKISTLTLACMESILPVDFILHDNGLIAGFLNHKEIKTRLRQKRYDLEDYFQGETNTSYLKLFQENCSNEKLFLKQFCSSLLFQILFPNMEWFQKKESWRENFFFFQNSFQIACRMEAEYIAEDKDHMLTVLTGKIAEPCSFQQLKNGNRSNEADIDNASGKIQIQYTTHKQNKCLIRAEATLIFNSEKAVDYKHHLTLTQMI
ncbi:hypothetical protein [Chryseobacterium polytrichastri]|uniref:LysM domain-containing protein n=1 Tax=Chryseobacterium polytrichastri TaxID=1302687 RepID=A0A1M6PHF8_9FLAO|nr:hypothetical protein [Chryseobacterium polytrichastri]SHK07330.1 hypothetical protein SAMN05444267_10019 [Chryseobacterium polytrichastri]